jgi:hypothetical protein
MNDQDSASGKQWHVERMRQDAHNRATLGPESPEAKAKRLADMASAGVSKGLRINKAIAAMLARHK